MTKRLTTEELQAIRKRSETATEGPWFIDGAIDVHSRSGGEVAAVWDGGADIEFIAEARIDIPKLLAEVERLSKENGEYERALSQIAHGDTWTAYPHDIAAWALGLKKEGDNV